MEEVAASGGGGWMEMAASAETGKEAGRPGMRPTEEAAETGEEVNGALEVAAQGR